MEPFQLTASQAASMISDRKLSPVILMESLLNRIEKLEPTLGAWVTLNRESAMEAAYLSERIVSQNNQLGPLHGIPIGLKDIFYTEGVKTTACSQVYKDFIPTYDASCVTKLKAAGAIMLGKTVTTPYAASDPSPTVNPWNPKHTPGGSSSGSSVAVAAQMCPLALGSQTVGSTVRPAAYNGIVGLKPTYGRISLKGVIGLGWSLDTVGLLARSTEDTALMLQVMAGWDREDPVSSKQPVPNYLDGLLSSKHPPRIGLIRDYFYELAQEEVKSHTDQIVQRFQNSGAIIEEISLPSSFLENVLAGEITFKAEAAAYHESNFMSEPNHYPPLIYKIIEEGMTISAIEYTKAQKIRSEFRRDLQEIFSNFPVLLTPSTPSSAPKDLTTTGDKSFQAPWTTAGVPTINIPSGVDTLGLPLGIQLLSGWNEEASLLASAVWCEKTLGLIPTPPIN